MLRKWIAIILGMAILLTTAYTVPKMIVFKEGAAQTDGQSLDQTEFDEPVENASSVASEVESTSEPETTKSAVTVEPTAAVESTDVAEPTAEVESTDVVEPTAAVESTDVAEPTAAVESTDVAEPTAAVESTDVAEPTAEVESTEAVGSTVTTEPTAAAEPTAEVESTEAVGSTETVEPTATVEPDVTAEPTATVEVDATGEHLVLEGLQGARQLLIGEQGTWRVVVYGAESVEYVLLNAEKTVVAQGSVDPANPQFALTLEHSGLYTLRVSASAGEECQTEETELAVSAGELKAEVVPQAKSCFGEDTVTFELQTNGGVAPVKAYVSAVQGDETLLDEEELFGNIISVGALLQEEVSEISVYVTLVDACGETANAFAVVPCALNERETRAQWESTMSSVSLSGNWLEDVLSIARTQLGYQESKVNFVIDEKEQTKGYTRYGDWYGASYSDWCAMYVSFCLHYAQIPKEYVPQEANCEKWIRALESCGLYRASGNYEPRSGDIVFFDWDGDGESDHVGIVEETDEYHISTIEGNSGNAVRRNEYHADDKTIMGYGSLSDAYVAYLETWKTPETSAAPESDGVCYYCGKVEHEHGDECRDAEGALICELEEHQHTEACREPIKYIYAALDGKATVLSPYAGTLEMRKRSAEDALSMQYALEIESLLSGQDESSISICIYDIEFVSQEETQTTARIEMRLDSIERDGDFIRIVRLGQDGWEWLESVFGESQGDTSICFEGDVPSTFAVVASQAMRTAFERFLAEIGTLVVPGDAADDAETNAYQAALADLKRRIEASLEACELTAEEYEALIALLPSDETVYEQLRAEVETFEKREQLDEAAYAEGDELLERISAAYEAGDLTEDEYDELSRRIGDMLYRGIAERAEGDQWIALKNSGYFSQYSAATSVRTARAATRSASALLQAEARAVEADEEAPSDQQVDDEGGSTVAENGRVSVSKTIAGTDVENVFDITLRVQTQEKISEIVQEPDIAVVVVMDISNTMNNEFGSSTRYKAAMDAAEEFLDQFAASQSLGVSKVGYVAFNTNAHQIFGLQSCVNQTQADALKNVMRTQTGNIINNYEKDSYGNATDVNRFTNIEAGLKMGADMLSGVNNKNKFIIFLSDGFPTTYISSGYQGYDTYDTAGIRFKDRVTGMPCKHGVSYSDEAAIRARNQATAIKQSGITIFSIGVDVAGQQVQRYVDQCIGKDFAVVDRTSTTYEIGDATSDSAYKNWLKNSIGSGYYYDSTDVSGLKKAYSDIFATIQKKVEAYKADWVTTDPLPFITNKGVSETIEFIGFYDKTSRLVDGNLVGNNSQGAENTAEFIDAEEEIKWDLKDSGYTMTVNGNTTLYTYSLVYRVRLRNENSDAFKEGVVYPTNDTTTLQYRVVESVNGSQQFSDLRTINYEIPSVHGYLAELRFTKVGLRGEALSGAEFRLEHDTNKCAVCHGDGEACTDIGPYTATSAADGAVVFEKIPSGHQYILTETKTPDGYYDTNGAFEVSVAYGTITFERQDGTIVNNMCFELPETGGEGAWRYSLCGSTLLTLAVLLFNNRRRRRWKDEA